MKFLETRFVCIVNSVKEKLEAIKNCLEELQETSNASTIVAEATGILKTLNFDRFKFGLQPFNQIMLSIKVIYNQMQS